MTTLQIKIDDELRAFLEAQAYQHGYKDVGEYLQALLREVQRRGGQQSSESAATDTAPADEDIIAGRVSSFESIDDLIANLKSEK